MAEKTTVGIGHLKEGGFVIIDDVPCVVTKITISTSGKHGHAKVRLEATGMLDGVNKSIVKPSHDTVQVPILNKKRGQVIAIVGEKAQIMDMEDFSVIELDIPSERKEKIKQGEEIDYYEIMDVKTLKELK